ncbi:MAG: hypothetical protein QOD10_3178 [Mycobacterium sp.]|jgi:hypothetical protein|nr:hypothetical protein [Mycobacterium sp.]
MGGHCRGVVGIGRGAGPGPSAIPTGSLLSLQTEWYTWQTLRSQPVATKPGHT